MGFMPYNTGSGASVAILFLVWHIAALACFFGIVLLILWAHKHLSAAQLKKWGAVLLIGGIVLCLLLSMTGIRKTMKWKMDGRGGMMMESSGMMMHNMNGMMMDADDMPMGGMMMEGMMHDDDMTMGDMVGMLKGNSGDDFDRAFIEGMVPHHQGAIDMAKLALQYAGHEEIRAMAEAIISAQQAEIDQMHGWQRAWGFAE